MSLIQRSQWRLTKRFYNVERRLMVPPFDTFGLKVEVQKRRYNHAFVEVENHTVTQKTYPISKTIVVLSGDMARSYFSQLLSSVGITTMDDDIFHGILSFCRDIMSKSSTIDTSASTCAPAPFLVIRILVVTRPVPVPVLVPELRKTLPASKSSVEALEKVMVAVEGSMNQCMICLEKFRVGVEVVTRMPCSHVYHGDCIVQWLETSHFCPVCRFKMPTC